MDLENLNNKPAVTDDISIGELAFKIREWYRYMLSKWIYIVAFGFIGGVLGFVKAYYTKPIYTSVTTFVLEDGASSGGGLGGLGGLASMVGVGGGGAGGGIFQGDNILELYKSRKMIEKTLLSEVQEGGSKYLLVDKYIEFNKLRENWEKRPELKKLKFEAINSGSPITKPNRLKDSILGAIVFDINKNYLVVAKPDMKLSIIKAMVKAPDESFAKAFNDEMVDNVNDFYIKTKTKKSQENISILQQKTDSVRTVMNGAIYTASVVSDATPNLNPTRQVQRTAPIQRSQFSAETNKEVLGELVKNLEMSKMALLKEKPLIQVLDQPILPLNKERASKIKTALIGGILAGFLVVFVFTMKLIFKNILKQN
ncbi:lipopolysaccharide biosynthesis protein [Pedobacter gandavensis]|uniref:Lipopolysaccharide biosynthesis protein n=1 Tax=Pedobacter gandavensis TaxID=2679963 RepID=A0ABR6EX93_9SPHI|nr:lipopolysaccharide biosynthesis protein [Pedobacter gandavensis]MBB2149910.1 lipopolysaccharide biosynthesis protein [Pedobacter gandavensis]